MGIPHSILQQVIGPNAAVSHQPVSLAVASATAVSGECESLNTQANNATASNCNVAAPARSSPDRVATSTVQELPFPAYEPTYESAPTTDPASGPNINAPPETPPSQLQPAHLEHVPAVDSSSFPQQPPPNGILNLGVQGIPGGWATTISHHCTERSQEFASTSVSGLPTLLEQNNGFPDQPDAANANGLVMTLSLEESAEKSSSLDSSAHMPLSLGTLSGTGAAHHTQVACRDPKAPKIASALDSELRNAGSELVFRVNRRRKAGLQGAGAHDLKMSELSAYFHLTAVNAAKKLGISLSTLKKACRKFGLYRWPGRKVRSLESTIHEVERTIPVGHGVSLEESNEVSKLQQEMDQLVHGSPAQVTRVMQSPAVRTADIHKHLHSRAWRSKSHIACYEDTLDTGNPAQQAPPTTSKYRKAVRGNQGRKGPRKLAASKEDSAVAPLEQLTSNAGKEHSRPGARDTVMKECDVERLLPDVHDMPNGAPEPALMADNGTTKCRARTSVGVGTEEATTTGERSPKRPRRE